MLLVQIKKYSGAIQRALLMVLTNLKVVLTSWWVQCNLVSP
jgi:hypothetical protein